MNTVASVERVLLHPLHRITELQDTVSGELGALAAIHAARSDFIEVLPSDTNDYPAQKLTHVFYDSSEPTDLETIRWTATISNPNYPNMVEELLRVERQSKLLSHINKYLAAGNNLVVVTPHGDIRDVAEVLATFYDALTQTQQESHQQPPDLTVEIMLSKILAHMGMYGEPAVKLIGYLCNRQYLSFPKTETMKEAGIPEWGINLYNGVLRKVVQHQLAQGGNLLGVALSGTTDKPIDGEDNVVGMAGVTPGTIKMITSAPRTRVIPCAVWRSPDDTDYRFEVAGVPRLVQTEDGVHTIMGDIALRLSSIVPTGTKFRYLDPRDVSEQSEPPELPDQE